MQKLSSRLDKISIRNILTIRYNPREQPPIPKIKWVDMRSNQSDSQGKKTEKIIQEYIYNKFQKIEEPISVSLSGGVDSTLCLALLRKYLPDHPIKAICGVFKGGFDESRIAKSISKKFNAKFSIVKMESLFTTMPELISVSGKPKWNTYQHLIAKKAKKEGSILVTGDGADELFGGYIFRYSKFLTLSRPKDNWKLKTINYLECHNRDWIPDQASIFGSKIKFSWEEIYNYFRTYFSNPLPILKQVMLADFNGKLLYDFIPSGQSIYKFYKINYFPLFLNSKIIKHALALPLEQKYDPKTQKGKLVLRKIAKRLKVSHLEEKHGFSPNLLFDWQSKGKKICQNYLLQKDSHIFRNKLINYNWVIRAFERVENDGDIRYLNRLISILALEIWYRIFITNEMNGNHKL